MEERMLPSLLELGVPVMDTEEPLLHSVSAHNAKTKHGVRRRLDPQPIFDDESWGWIWAGRSTVELEIERVLGQ